MEQLHSSQSFPKSLVTESGQSYVIDTDIELIGDLIIAPGVTLIFMGGKFINKHPNGSIIKISAPPISTATSDVTIRPLPQEGVTLIAPLSVIFGKNIEVDGYWNIEYSSPLWFEPVNRPTRTDGTMLVADYADCINRAIEMKLSGDVYLPAGFYHISKPIKIPQGVTLRGDAGQLYSPQATIIAPLGTVRQTGSYDVPINAGSDSLLRYNHDFMVLANVIPKTPSKNIESHIEKSELNTTSNFTVDKSEVTHKDGSKEYINRYFCKYEGLESNDSDLFEWEIAYANAWVALKNISFINEKLVYQYKQDNDTYTNIFDAYNNNLPRCVYASSGAQFEHVIWYDFIQALCYTYDYNDSKRVQSCSAWIDSPYPSPSWDNLSEIALRKFYLLNLQGLGDALCFANNHVSSPLKRTLYLHQCGGGTINHNIIHGSVSFLYCKAVAYSCNHMEDGTFIDVSQSEVNFSSNYIEKGDKPSLTIRGSEASRSIVSLSNDQFVFFSRTRNDSEVKEKNNNDNNADTSLKNDWPIIKKRIMSISEYDIDIDQHSLLSISNTFRFDLIVGFGDMLPYGLKIKTPTSDLAEFNEYSYFCSQESTILPNWHVRCDYSEKDLNSPHCYFYKDVPTCNEIPWLRPAGTYYYSYEILWDKIRNIKAVRDNRSYFTISSVTFSGIGQHGLLINLGWLNGSYMIPIRLYRTYRAAGIALIEYVDLHLCGTNVFYDNGISIAGYKWAPTLEPVPSPLIPHQYETYQINSNQVIASTASIPSEQSLLGWQMGDVIRNVGANVSWSEKIIKKSQNS